MGKITHLYKDTKISISNNEIVDPNSGELFDISNASLMKRTKTGEIAINYQEYFYLDTTKLNLLIKNKIKQVDLALLISISILTDHNICMSKEDTPHSAATIGLLINNSKQAIKKKLNRLEDSGLLYHGYIRQRRRYGKVYVVNPHLIKKGHKHGAFLAELFNDIF